MSSSDDYERLLKAVKDYIPQDLEIVKKAYDYAKVHHLSQKRDSGEEYITHPVNVALILTRFHVDSDTLCAALLHDTIEDTTATKEDIALMFNETIAMLVDGVTKFHDTSFNGKKIAIENASMRKLILGITSDVRIIAIKLADRLHNMRTLSYRRVEKQIENAKETFTYYCPLATLIGAFELKKELEDLSLSYLDVNKYNEIVKFREEKLNKCSNIIKKVQSDLERLLKENQINYDIRFRLKGINSIYRKLKMGHKYTDIHDILVLKICVENINDCYKLLGIIHQNYRPMHSKFKDYIGNPKNNLYRSLHTTVFAASGILMQIQIRTFDMDKIDERGLIAFLDVDSNDSEHMTERVLEKNIPFIRALKHIDVESQNDADFANRLKQEAFSQKIHVFTPEGNIMELPKGATAVDFAYQIHTDVGNHLAKVAINGEFVKDPTAILHNLDYIQIITDDNVKGPEKRWLRKVVTSKARRKIRDFYKK